MFLAITADDIGLVSKVLFKTLGKWDIDETGGGLEERPSHLNEQQYDRAVQRCQNQFHLIKEGGLLID